MSILAIIPARRDSKRCPGKNTRQLDGVSLFEYTLDLVYKFQKNFDRYCITTNDNKILKGLNTVNKFDKIKQPEAISKEIADGPLNEFQFIEFVLDWYKKQDITFDDVAIFYPTVPFRKIKTVEKILKQWQTDRQWAAQLRSVKEIRWEPEKIWQEYKDKTGELLVSYQLLLYNKKYKHYKQVPYCYIYKVDNLNKSGHYFYQPVSKFVINDPVESHDINTEHDFWIAEQIVNKEKEGLNE